MRVKINNKKLRVLSQQKNFSDENEDRKNLYDGIDQEGGENLVSKTKLQSEYEVWDLSYGDRLRVMDGNRELHDIILMPDGSVAIQDLDLKIEYGQTRKFNSWEEVAEALGDVTVEQGIKA